MPNRPNPLQLKKNLGSDEEIFTPNWRLNNSENIIKRSEENWRRNGLSFGNILLGTDGFCCLSRTIRLIFLQSLLFRFYGFTNTVVFACGLQGKLNNSSNRYFPKICWIAQKCFGSLSFLYTKSKQLLHIFDLLKIF